MKHTHGIASNRHKAMPQILPAIEKLKFPQQPPVQPQVALRFIGAFLE